MTRRVLLLVAVVALALFVRSRTRDPANDALQGLWMLSPARAPSDDLRFYYFHEGGKGLYRYGQAAYNQTHSFDWQLDGDRLTLRFRKMGERAETRVVLGEHDGARTLALLDDPRGQGRVVYRREPSALADESGPLSLAESAADETSGALAGRMWIDHQRYATGGEGFRMYQLSKRVLRAGWRLGWHHLGDGDDWTTETLAYREEPGALRVRYVLRGDELAIPMTMGRERQRRTLTLERDPRNFLHRTRLVDGGPSFM